MKQLNIKIFEHLIYRYDPEIKVLISSTKKEIKRLKEEINNSIPVNESSPEEVENMEILIHNRDYYEKCLKSYLILQKRQTSLKYKFHRTKHKIKKIFRKIKLHYNALFGYYVHENISNVIDEDEPKKYVSRINVGTILKPEFEYIGSSYSKEKEIKRAKSVLKYGKNDDNFFNEFKVLNDSTELLHDYLMNQAEKDND